MTNHYNARIQSLLENTQACLRAKENVMKGCDLKTSHISSMESLNIGSVSTLKGSLESLSRKIKYNSGLVVELRDEQIIRLNELFVTHTETYRKNWPDKLEVIGRTILEIIKTKFDYTERFNLLMDETVIERLREPVINTYNEMLYDRVSLKTLRPENFDVCLNFNTLINDLVKSDHIKHIPTMFLQEKGATNFNRVVELLEALDVSVEEQAKSIELLLSRTLEVLRRGEELPLADKIDLDKAKFVSSGVEISALIVTAVQGCWYRNNLTTTVGAMASDLHVVLSEPLEMTSPNRKEVSHEGIHNLVTFLVSKDNRDNLEKFQRVCTRIVDRIRLISMNLTKYTDHISSVPEKTTDGYYSFALEDLARLISVFSTALYTVNEFVNDCSSNIFNGLERADKQATAMISHKRSVERYIAERKRHDNL